jgi:hypothetical protein
MLINFFNVLLLTTLVFANDLQDEKATQVDSLWKKTLISKVHITQSNYDNWAQGGENTFSWQVNLNGALDRDWEKITWSNEGKFSYGRAKVGKGEARKSADEIKFESVLSYNIGIRIDPYVALALETQATAGYQYTNGSKRKITDFLDPAYLTQSFGFEYGPNKIFKTRMGLAVREIITRKYWQHSDDPNTENIEKTSTTIGMESVSNLNLKLSENIVLKSKLEFFSDMSRIATVDVRWDNLVSAKVAEYIDVAVNIKLIYDRDISLRRQMKQVWTVGFTYSFF